MVINVIKLDIKARAQITKLNGYDIINKNALIVDEVIKIRKLYWDLLNIK